MFHGIRFLRNSRQRVPINCRTPTPESTRLSGREKLEWAAFIAVLTIIPVGLQLQQFYSTSAVNVNKQVHEEMSRRRTEQTSTRDVTL